MATITSSLPPEPHAPEHHDRLRAAAPVLAATALLLAVLLGGALLAGNLFELGVLFMTTR